jgi:hypothetical protein
MDWIPTAMPHFNRYIGIDYSGAETPDSSCRGLRVYVAEGMDVWRHRSGSSAGSRNEQRWQGHSSGSIRVMETVGLAPSGEL